MRHYGGFILAGSTALVTDISVFQALYALVSVNAFIARLLSITVAMIVSFLINRAVTFAVPGRPRFIEFLRFAAVAWMSSGLNYILFATVMLAAPGTWPVLAILLATAISMFASYMGMRMAVFHRR